VLVSTDEDDVEEEVISDKKAKPPVAHEDNNPEEDRVPKRRGRPPKQVVKEDPDAMDSDGIESVEEVDVGHHHPTPGHGIHHAAAHHHSGGATVPPLHHSIVQPRSSGGKFVPKGRTRHQLATFNYVKNGKSHGSQAAHEDDDDEDDFSDIDHTITDEKQIRLEIARKKAHTEYLNAQANLARIEADSRRQQSFDALLDKVFTVLGKFADKLESKAVVASLE
jgi:hypothetical protein